MRNRFSQSAIISVCLLAVVTQAAIGAAGVVYCTHVDGLSHIEFSCARDAQSRCLSDCGNTDSSCTSALKLSNSIQNPGQPCSDKPLGEDAKSTVAAFKTVKVDFPTPLLIAVLPPLNGSWSMAVRSGGDIHRPVLPVTIISIQTVVLLV